MIRADYISVRARALAEPFGVKLSFPDPQDRNRAARKFYKIRDQLRERGDSSFNVLSLLQQGEKELLIFQRNKIASPAPDDGIQPNKEALAANDLPTQFRRPRGAPTGRPYPPIAIRSGGTT
jgi:hypothetical protein